MNLANLSALALLCVVPQDPATRRGTPVDPGPAARELASGGVPARVPFQWISNQVRLDATIDGRGPFRLILDTGMPVPGILLFQNERVAALDLGDSGGRAALAGAGSEKSSTDATVTNGANLALGDLELGQVGALILPAPAGFPPGVDGVIGGELFFHHVVRVDVDQQRLELSAPAGWSPPAGACVVPLENRAGKIFVDLQVAVGTDEPIPARVVVDLGASHALSLNTQASGRFAPPANAIDAPLGRGISGVVLGKLGRARRVEIGTFAFEDVVTSFPTREHQRPGGFDFGDGNLGAEILKRFNVTFDYAASRMVLEKSRGFGEPFEREMAGLSFVFGEDGTLAIHSVLPGSPAADAGLAEGDRVLAIDGREVSALGENGVRKSLTADGVEVRLSVRRGAETFEKKLRLRRLV